MPASDSGYATDTSLAVASLDPNHSSHELSRATAVRWRPALCGHAAFETYSVLTRLPGAARTTPAVANELLRLAFPERCWLKPAQQQALLGRLSILGIAGGMVYDALVGEAARVAGRTLLTRDARAARTYELLKVSFDLIE